MRQEEVQDERMSGNWVGLRHRSIVTKAGQIAYWSVLTVVFGWAIWMRFRLPLDPLADGDASGYLYPGLSTLGGNGFVRHGRNFLYPGFLFLLLRCFGDLRAITIVQHLLGIATGGLFLITWRAHSRFSSACKPAVPCLSVVGAASGDALLACRGTDPF